MSQRIKTSTQDIAEYWSLQYPDKSLCSHKCWRCGIKKRLDRAHIQALSIDGQDQPDNFVLLCKHCHIDAPNVDGAHYMWHWLDFYRDRPYDELWFFEGVRTFNMLYGKDFDQLLAGHEVEFYVAFKAAAVHATRHFGQPSLNASTTSAIIHTALKHLNLI